MDVLKRRLSVESKMKDLDAAKKILGMEILYDRIAGVLCLYQKKYIENIRARFNMQSAKSVSTPLAKHLKLLNKLSLQTKDEEEHMSRVLYYSAMGSIMYAMICTRPDIL